MRLVISLPKMRWSMCLLNQFIINIDITHYKFIMRYNQLTYHKASPFYKQDYLPDRAWYNRKPKDFPSEIPTGQDYFTDSGRKHYAGKFMSEIASDKILQSPERYVFENRIALDKGYMRNLDTIDIEGAASGTRVNQSIKNKFKAQQQLARRYNVSLDMSEHKEKTYDEKKRMIAFKQYETLKQKKQKQAQDQMQSMNASRVSQNYDKYGNNNEQLSQQVRNSIYNQYNQQGMQQIKLIPKPYYSKIAGSTDERNPHRKGNQQMYQMERPKAERQEKIMENNKMAEQRYQQQQAQKYYQQQVQRYQQQQAQQHELSDNYRHKNNPQVYPSLDVELNRRKDEYAKNSELDEMTRLKMQDKKEFRKNNPTNLSFNLAAQSIVANNMHN